MKFLKKTESSREKNAVLSTNRSRNIILSVFFVVFVLCDHSEIIPTNHCCFAGTTAKSAKEYLQNRSGKSTKSSPESGGIQNSESNKSRNNSSSTSSPDSGSESQIIPDTNKNTTQNSPSGSENGKCSLAIPKAIKQNIPEDMQYIVFMQMIFNLIRQEYVYELSEGEILEKAIDGFLSSLDPHTSYLNDKAFNALKNQTDGEFGGLGIEIMMDESFVRVISPIDDTPAYKAGLKSGDLIIYIDDECINGLSAEEVLEKLRGKPGTKVKLKIKRSNKLPFDIVITRGLIKVQSVKTEILDNIGYVRISTFDKNTTKGIKKFLNDNRSKKLHGIVLDLRNNPGGLLDECVSSSDIFLDGGKIVSTRGRTAENTMEFKASPGDMSKGIPLVVLINNGTASAPEIMAGALRDNKRAIIVGTRSFGKGSVQKVIPLSETIAIRLTVAKYFTPSGECIQANGITPDIEADWAEIKKPEVMFVMREESFSNALDADKRKDNKKKSDEENRKALETLEKLSKKRTDKHNEKTSEDSDKNDEEDYELLYRTMSLKERVEKDFQLSKAFDIIKTIEKMRIIDAERACKKR